MGNGQRGEVQARGRTLAPGRRNTRRGVGVRDAGEGLVGVGEGVLQELDNVGLGLQGLGAILAAKIHRGLLAGDARGKHEVG